MAYVHSLVRRQCPATSFETLEQVVSDVVGPVVYEDEYPNDADVDVSFAHAKLGTFMALKVEIDTEDLPSEGWVITESGLCVRAASKLAVSGTPVSWVGLSEEERDRHFKVQAKDIHDRLVGHEVWTSGNIGWNAEMDASTQLGVLVTRAEGAWHASYTEIE